MFERRSQLLHRELLTAFPALEEPLRAAGESLAAQASAFGQFTQEAKVAGDWPLFERCAALADQLLARADPALTAAFQPAFFEHLDFEGSRGPAAWQLLTGRLQTAWKQMDAENRRLMALPQNRRPDGRGGRPGGRPGGRSGPPKGQSHPRGRKGRGGTRGRGRGRS
jgi:hypothetical protein